MEILIYYCFPIQFRQSRGEKHRCEQKEVVVIYMHYDLSMPYKYTTICTHPFLSRNSLSGLVTTSISGLSLIWSCQEGTLLCRRSDVFAIEIDAAGVLTLINACVEITNIANSSNRIDLDVAMSTTNYHALYEWTFTLVYLFSTLIKNLLSGRHSTDRARLTDLPRLTYLGSTYPTSLGRV